METQRKEYNCWSTYETWAVGMYLDGNYTGESTYREAQAITAEATQRLTELREVAPDTEYIPELLEARDALALRLAEYVHETAAPAPPGTSMEADCWRTRSAKRAGRL